MKVCFSCIFFPRSVVAPPVSLSLFQALLCTMEWFLVHAIWIFGGTFRPRQFAVVSSCHPPNSTHKKATTTAPAVPAKKEKLVETNTSRYHQWNELYTYLSVQSFMCFPSFPLAAPSFHFYFRAIDSDGSGDGYKKRKEHRCVRQLGTRTLIRICIEDFLNKH